jgi:hypothetical protein
VLGRSKRKIDINVLGRRKHKIAINKLSLWSLSWGTT